jgi:hypothetical protein
MNELLPLLFIHTQHPFPIGYLCLQKTSTDFINISQGVVRNLSIFIDPSDTHFLVVLLE